MTHKRLLALTVSSLLAATALSSCNRANPPAGAVNDQPQGSLMTAADQGAASVNADGTPLPPPVAADAAPALAYADVVRVQPVTEKERQYGTVTAVNAVTAESSVPKQVCNDVVVEERQPERDGNTGGTVIGAVVGGLLGNQVGKGSGKTAATVAGAVAGGYAGHAIDKRHQGGQVVTHTEQQCHEEAVSSNRTIGYDVTFRTADGSTDSKRMDNRPSIGSRIALGSAKTVVGYDVTYEYEGRTATVRMDHKPGDRLPVIDGAVVTASASVPNG
jgi:uncharacterized protein YcfJ